MGIPLCRLPLPFSLNSHLIFMKGLLEAGQVVPVIDRRYPLSEVTEAVRYYGGGHAQGKVVITVEKR